MAKELPDKTPPEIAGHSVRFDDGDEDSFLTAISGTTCTVKHLKGPGTAADLTVTNLVESGVEIIFDVNGGLIGAEYLLHFEADGDVAPQHYEADALIRVVASH